jgi:Na+/glutamate symporter
MQIPSNVSDVNRAQVYSCINLQLPTLATKRNVISTVRVSLIAVVALASVKLDALEYEYLLYLLMTIPGHATHYQDNR